MTILSYGRLYQLEPVANAYLPSITLKSKGVIPRGFREFVESKLSAHTQDPSCFNNTNFPVSLGQGPKGPALSSAIEEAMTMPEEMRDILPLLREDLRLAVDWIKDSTDDVRDMGETIPENPQWVNGKISFISDKEAKTRVIAIPNY